MRSQLSEEYEALEPYFRIAERQPPLTREGEYDLARRARKGDEKARRLLVNHNVAFVLSMCRRWAGKGVRLDDIVPEASPAIAFAQTEIQLVDATTARANEEGENAHSRYKKRPSTRVRVRLDPLATAGEPAPPKPEDSSELPTV